MSHPVCHLLHRVDEPDVIRQTLVLILHLVPRRGQRGEAPEHAPEREHVRARPEPRVLTRQYHLRRVEETVSESV